MWRGYDFFLLKMFNYFFKFFGFVLRDNFFLVIGFLLDVVCLVDKVGFCLVLWCLNIINMVVSMFINKIELFMVVNKMMSVDEFMLFLIGVLGIFLFDLNDVLIKGIFLFLLIIGFLLLIKGLIILGLGVFVKKLYFGILRIKLCLLVVVL